MKLRKQFGFDNPPTIKPKYRMREIGAFYPHWALHNRSCDATGKPLVSIFHKDCVYPVWDWREWFTNAHPPSADIDFDRTFFDQARDVFFKSPIPHIFQHKCENCEYADDWYDSRDCYLCHGGDDNE